MLHGTGCWAVQGVSNMTLLTKGWYPRQMGTCCDCWWLCRGHCLQAGSVRCDCWGLYSPVGGTSVEERVPREMSGEVKTTPGTSSWYCWARSLEGRMVYDPSSWVPSGRFHGRSAICKTLLVCLILGFGFWLLLGKSGPLGWLLLFWGS